MFIDVFFSFFFTLNHQEVNMALIDWNNDSISNSRKGDQQRQSKLKKNLK